MKLKEITIGKGRKIGLPNYSSVDVHASITVTLDQDEELTEEKRQILHNTVQREIDHALKPYEIDNEIKQAQNSTPQKRINWS